MDEKPVVIPSLREWTYRSGHFWITPHTRILVHQPFNEDLEPAAEFLRLGIGSTTGLSLAKEGAAEPAPGSIFLSLENDGVQIPDQGYSLDISDRVTLGAQTPRDIFYGLQTILQLLRGTSSRRSLPQGQALDFPQFPQRGLMLDLGRKYWHMNYLHELMVRMAGLKLNFLHLHFTDWNAFRLQSDLNPDLAAEESYSKAELTQLQAWADYYHITLIPEIDLPGHATAITRYNPNLAMHCRSMSYGRWRGGENGGWTINYADPTDRQWMRDLFTEFLPVFSGPYFHIGTDEVPDGEAPAQCKELVRYAAAQGYPHAGDVLIEWINEMNELLRAHGKQMQIWNWWERSPHSQLPETDIVINHWVGTENPEMFLRHDYQVICSPEDTHYITPGYGLYPDVDYLYSRWQLNTHPKMLGYKICAWADEANDQTDAFFENKLIYPRAILAERTWNPDPPTRPLAEFLSVVGKVQPNG